MTRPKQPYLKIYLIVFLVSQKFNKIHMTLLDVFHALSVIRNTAHSRLGSLISEAMGNQIHQTYDKLDNNALHCGTKNG